MRLRAASVLLATLALASPPALADPTIPDPAGDTRTFAGPLLAPYGTCHDPAADLLGASLLRDGADLVVRLSVENIDAWFATCLDRPTPRYRGDYSAHLTAGEAGTTQVYLWAVVGSGASSCIQVASSVGITPCLGSFAVEGGSPTWRFPLAGTSPTDPRGTELAWDLAGSLLARAWASTSLGIEPATAFRVVDSADGTVEV